MLSKMYKLNPLFGRELSKLPDLRTANGTCDNRSIETFIRFYTKHEHNILKSFEEMIKVGKPAVRKFCSPLQALYWLIQDEKMIEAEEVVTNYHLRNLLATSWIEEDDLDNIVDRYKFQRRNSPFSSVINRLNSPELVDFYTRRFFRVRFTHVAFPEIEPITIWIRKYANCYEYSLFVTYCLRQNGYEAYIFIDEKPHCFIGFVNTDSKLYVIDNASTKPKGICGPYKNEEELTAIWSCRRLS